jgi:ABC-type sugar transport system ATPase subunit
MSSVAFRSVSKAYRGTLALDRFELTVEPESFTVICGPPRSGKSVMFRLLVGLERPDSGAIEIDGKDITTLSAAQRPIGYVPQSFALYPHLKVFDNIAYPLRLAGVARDEIARRVDRAAGILSIGHLLGKTPDQLSGGEKQRTAVSRGLLKNATLFVLDDPLAGLDYKLRERLMDDLKSLREELKATFLYATSDSLEALTLAQRLVVLDGGRAVQHGDPVGVYDEPLRLRALELIGFPRANVVLGVAAGNRVTAGPLTFLAPRAVRDGAIVVGFRPEAIKPATGRGIDGRCRIQLVENLGSEFVIHVDAGGKPLTMSFPVAGRTPPALDSEIDFSIDPLDIVLFDPTDGRRLAGGEKSISHEAVAHVPGSEPATLLQQSGRPE